MKRIFLAFLSCLLVFSVCVSASQNDFALNDVESAIVAEKMALREYAKESPYIAAAKSMDQAIRKEERNATLSELLSGEIDADTAVEKLETLGVFVLESSIQYLATPMASPTSLEFNDVIVSHDAIDDTWLLGGGVYWTDDSWLDDVGYEPFPSVGMTIDVGGLNGLGIRLYDTSGSYNGCALEDTWLYVSAGGGMFATTTHSPAYIAENPSASGGVFHEFQDYAYLADLSGLVGTYLYYGRHMSVFAEYNSEFVNYHGRARLQYVHTWDGANISSISLGYSGGFGFEIVITNEEESFTATNNSETLF